MYHSACSKPCSVTSFRITQHLGLGRAIGILALCAGLLASFPAWAQGQNIVHKFAGTGAGDWSNPGNVVGPADNNCSNMGAVGKANLTYNFNFVIPVGATITGATAYIKAGANSNQNIGVQLASNASVEPPTTIGNQLSLLVPAAANAACSSTVVASIGTDLASWGLGSLAPATVNTTQFGLVFTKLEESTLKVDSICLQITYLSDGPTTQLECFSEPPPLTNTITIVKQVVGTPPESDWAFAGTGGIGNFTLPAAGGFLNAANLADGTYTITETPKAGYTVTSECFIDDASVATGDEEISVTVEAGETGEFASCVFTNTFNTASFTVNKTYDDGGTAPVTINLVCNGDVTTNDLQAAPGSPAVFEVSGWTDTPICTATESDVPPGYTADDTGCNEIALLDPGSCTIANTANTGSFTVRKLYTDDAEAPVSVTASCTAPATVTNNPQMASPSGSAIFDVTRVVPGVTTCTASEVVPSGYTADQSDCQDNDPIDGGCAITNTPIPPAARATFRVIKDFTDDNPSEVLVSIDCNTGLILDQSKLISEGDDVVFVVTDFDLGELNCEISEEIPNGYSPTYDASIVDGVADEPTEDELACYFENVESGEFQCLIVNTPDPVDVVIEKVWVIEASGGNGVDTSYDLKLYCDAEIVGGYTKFCYENGEVTLGEGDENDNYTWCDTFSGDDSDVFTGQVIPEYPSSQCWVEERVYDDSVEIDNGCRNLVVSAGNGDSCVITNTVFFEGIPTLSQYGKILLVLLMLGMGIVGFRRIV